MNLSLSDDFAAPAARTSENVLAKHAQEQLVPRNVRIERTRRTISFRHFEGRTEDTVRPLDEPAMSLTMVREMKRADVQRVRSFNRLVAERIGAARTVGCLVNWAADWIAPGRVQFGGTGSLVVGELDGALTPRVRDLADLLSAVMPTGVTDNIWGCLWAKLCYASLLFATALTDETIYDVAEGPPPIQRMLVRLVVEGMAVAEASGVRLVAFDEYDPAWYRAASTGDDAAVAQAMMAVSRFYRIHTKVKTGIWRDLAVRKRKTEVDTQAGVIAAKGRSLGIPTPLTDRVIAMIHELEDGRRAMAWSNLEELARC